MPKRKSRYAKPKPPWPESAAKYAWASVVAALLVPTCLNFALIGNPSGGTPSDADQLQRLTPSVVYGLLAVSGIGAGALALLVMGKYGKPRIMVPAITGIALHVVLAVVLFAAVLPAMDSARQKLQEQQQQKQPQPQSQPGT